MAFWDLGAKDLLSPVTNFLGGVVGEKGADSRNEQSLALAREQIAAQREFAQMGVRWRAEDARAAGIHPIYALGAQTHSFSPVGVNMQGPSYGLAEAFANSGQDLSRSIRASQTAPERAMSEHQLLMQGLAAENAQLNNDYLRAQIAKLNAPQVGPPLPLAATTSPSGAVEFKPDEVTSTQSNNPSVTAGIHAPTKYIRDVDGGLTPIPHTDTIEDPDLTSLPYLEWLFTNRLLPGGWDGLNANPPEPPRSALPPGAMGWRWSRMKRWEPYYPRPGKKPSSSGRFFDRLYDHFTGRG